MRPWLNNISKESRERIIKLESELRKCDEQIAWIDNLLELDGTGECLLSFYD